MNKKNKRNRVLISIIIIIICVSLIPIIFYKYSNLGPEGEFGIVLLFYALGLPTSIMGVIIDYISINYFNKDISLYVSPILYLLNWVIISFVIIYYEKVSNLLMKKRK